MSNISTNVLSNMLMNQSKEENTVQQENPSLIMFGEKTQEKIKPIDKIQINTFDKESLIKSGVINLLVIILSTLLPVSWMLRDNHKVDKRQKKELYSKGTDDIINMCSNGVGNTC
jgi:hypothetical protein